MSRIFLVSVEASVFSAAGIGYYQCEFTLNVKESVEARNVSQGQVPDEIHDGSLWMELELQLEIWPSIFTTYSETTQEGGAQEVVPCDKEHHRKYRGWV